MSGPDVASDAVWNESPLDERALAGLRELQREGDADRVERIAHTLRGSSGNTGATRMAKICSELQEIGASGELSCTPEELVRLEFGRLRPALEDELARSGN